MQKSHKRKVKMENRKTSHSQANSHKRGTSSALLAFSSACTNLTWGSKDPHQPCRSTRVWLETFMWRIYRDCNRRRHSSRATTDCVWMRVKQAPAQCNRSKMQLEWYPLLELYSCLHKFCENTNLKEILEDDSTDREDNINDEEGEKGE